MATKPKHFEKIYQRFSANISQRYDCGRFCAPLNGGQPVCCTTDHAIPVVEKAEFKLLKKRTDLWRKFKPFDAASKQIVDDLASSCTAIECKGAAFCERDNRTLACRSFPFFPYFTRERELVGLGYYWTFEDRCWVISHLEIVERDFIREMVAAYEYLFEHDEDELEAFVSQSVSMRRVFSRWDRPFPVIGRDGGFFKVLPKSDGALLPAKFSEFSPLGPFKSERAYAKAVREAGGDPKTASLNPPAAAAE